MTDQGGIVGEVETAYRRYVEVFNSRDANDIAELYDRPHAQVIGEMGLSIVNDDADQQGWYEFVIGPVLAVVVLEDRVGPGATAVDELVVVRRDREVTPVLGSGAAVTERTVAAVGSEVGAAAGSDGDGVTGRHQENTGTHEQR